MYFMWNKVWIYFQTPKTLDSLVDASVTTGRDAGLATLFAKHVGD